MTRNQLGAGLEFAGKDVVSIEYRGSGKFAVVIDGKPDEELQLRFNAASSRFEPPDFKPGQPPEKRRDALALLAERMVQALTVPAK
jgi:hypothetical protein